MAQIIKTDKYQERGKVSPLSFKEVAIVSRNEGYLGYTDINAETNFPFKKDFAIKFDIEVYNMKRNGEINEIVNRFVDYDLISDIALDQQG